MSPAEAYAIVERVRAGLRTSGTVDGPHLDDATESAIVSVQDLLWSKMALTEQVEANGRRVVAWHIADVWVCPLGARGNKSKACRAIRFKPGTCGVCTRELVNVKFEVP